MVLFRFASGSFLAGSHRKRRRGPAWVIKRRFNIAGLDGVAS
jgi:hypothetical protein